MSIPVSVSTKFGPCVDRALVDAREAEALLNGEGLLDDRLPACSPDRASSVKQSSQREAARSWRVVFHQPFDASLRRSLWTTSYNANVSSWREAGTRADAHGTDQRCATILSSGQSREPCRKGGIRQLGCSRTLATKLACFEFVRACRLVFCRSGYYTYIHMYLL